MNKVRLAVVILVGALAARASEGVNTKTPSSIRIHNCTAQGRTAAKVLSDLAQDYHIVIGIYGAGPASLVERSEPVDFEVKNGTLADVFDAIAKAHKLRWHQEANGAVHFVFDDAPLPLMDVRVHAFDYDNPQWPAITDHLRGVPEVYNWLQERKCALPGPKILLGGKPPKQWKRFAIHARDITVAAILDQIASDSRTYFWHAAQVTGPDTCYVSIQWWL